jgi:phosphate transport system substrate-binding protein
VSNVAFMSQGPTRSRRAVLLGVVPILLTLAACRRVETPKVTPAPVRVRLGADSAVIPLVRALAQAYQRERPNWAFTFETGNAVVINGLVAAGTIDLAAVSVLPDTETFKPWFTDLAVDGIAVIVNAANPVNGLTLAEVRDVFAGFRNEWAFFGAQQSGSILTVVREEDEGSRAVFDRQVMGGVSVTSSAVVMPTPETVTNYVALNPGAIGYVPSGRITAAPQPAVKMLALDGQAVTIETLATGAYPLRRSLYLLARSEPQARLREFSTWMFSPDARAITTSLGYATLS